jgi:hypothetical protein
MQKLVSILILINLFARESLSIASCQKRRENNLKQTLIKIINFKNTETSKINNVMNTLFGRNGVLFIQKTLSRGNSERSILCNTITKYIKKLLSVTPL